VVFDRLPLETEAGARTATDALETIRAEVSRLTTACGFHVHVDPRPCDFSDVASLYHLWNGVEDILYRLAGAGWAGGHRGDNYCRAVPKGLLTSKAIGAGMARQRYYGLNLENITRAMLSCECGAMRWGSWSECECRSIRQPTVEFRVWNATRTVRKAHAYVALSLGLVAAAHRTHFDVKRVGTLAWNGEGYRHPAGRTDKALRRVLALPMTTFDRECVMALVRGSSVPDVIGAARMTAIETQYGNGAAAPGPFDAAMEV
jgi:hypothetical protein